MKLRLLGEITTSDMQVITILKVENERELKSFLMRVIEKSEKAGLKLKKKLSFKKLRSWHPVPSLHGK